MKTCLKCGELNGEDRTSCFSCRETLPKAPTYRKMCPKCHAVYTPKTERCDDCGIQLAVYDSAADVYARQSAVSWWHYAVAILFPLIGLIMGLVYLSQGDYELAKTMITTVVVCAILQIVLGVLLAACGMLA